jgi:hypothetical protein
MLVTEEPTFLLYLVLVLVLLSTKIFITVTEVQNVFKVLKYFLLKFHH